MTSSSRRKRPTTALKAENGLLRARPTDSNPGLENDFPGWYERWPGTGAQD